MRFPYDPSIIAQLKAIPGHRWHPEQKQWSFPLDIESAKKIMRVLENKKVEIAPELRLKLQVLDESAEKDLQELRRLMRLKNYSSKTMKAYLSCVRIFTKYFHPRHPRELSDQDIRDYLLHLIESEKQAASSVNQVFNALRYLYVELYKMQFKIGGIPRPKKEKKLPDVLNEEEVLRIFQSVKNLKHRIMLMMTYASGLRVSEVVSLRIEDIDVNRRLIHIRGAKGKKDRYTPLAELIIEPLHIYWQAYTLGASGWLFPGSKPDYHIAVRSIQAVFERAARAAGITKPVSMHTLRHSYATHSHEHGYDIRYIQKLLGHQSLKTTEIYTHISRTDIANIRSPLDFLKKENLLDKNSSDGKLLEDKTQKK